MWESAFSYLPEITATAVEATVAQWQADEPGVAVLALVPEAESAGVPVLQQSCAKRDVRLAGAVFPALIESERFVQRGAWLLRCARVPYLAIHSDLPRGGTALERVLDRLTDDLSVSLGDVDGEATLFTIFDAMVPNVETILDHLYLRLANRVHYMGVNAGSESFRPIPCLFDSGRMVGAGAIVALMAGSRGAALAHGYQMPSRLTLATSAEGNRIRHIDWRPAFEVYRELVLEQYGVAVDRSNFYQYAVHFPFGVVRASGVHVVRIPVALEDDGSLFCVGEVRSNSVLCLLRAPEVDSVQTVDAVARGVRALNGAVGGRELLLFYCAGRRLHLGLDAAREELAALQRRLEAGAIAGALSLGEIGSSAKWAYPLFHNATLVASLWRE